MSFVIGIIAFLFLTERISAWEIQDPVLDFLPEDDPLFAPVKWNAHLLSSGKHKVNDARNEVLTDTAMSFVAQRATNFVCPFHYGKFPDPEDCSSYYACMHKKPKKKKCPKNQNFDKISKKCVDKSKAVCADKDDNKEHQKIDFECPYSYGRYPNTKDCSKFFLCLHKKPALMICSSGTLYDVKSKKCTDKSKVKCGSRFNPYEETTSTVTARPPSRRTKKPSTPTMTTRLKRTTSSVSITQSPSVPYHSDSTSVTSDHVATITTRIPSETTVEDNKSTTRKEETEDFSKISTEGSTSTKDLLTPTQKPESSSTNLNNESTISKVLTTSEGDITSSSTNQAYSSTFEETNVPETSTTGPTASPSDQWTTPATETTLSHIVTDETKGFICPERKGKFPYSEDCSKYYNCKKSEAKLEECGIGTLFDEKRGFCYSEKDVDCGYRKRPNKEEPTTESETTSTTMLSDETPSITVGSTSLPSTPSTITTLETTLNELITKEPRVFVCQTKKGKFPFHEDCSKYYNCKKSEAKLEDCGFGTLFDEKRGFCYSENDVDCGSRKRPEQRVYKMLTMR